MEKLSIAGDVSSILGLLMTFWVIYKLRSIRLHFLFQARLPTLKKKVSNHRAELSKLLNSYPSSIPDIETELQKCSANLQSLKSKLRRNQGANVRKLLKSIKDLSSSPLNPESKPALRRVYLHLTLLAGELENLTEDIKWRSPE